MIFSKHTFISGVTLGALFLSGCSLLPSSDSTTSTITPSTNQAPAATEKQGDTSKTGTITQSAGRFYLNVPGQIPEEIESYAVDLASYVGQSVTITGQYSGDTLFVGQVQ